jgi:Mg2+ and Co2+ transporter CorA
MPKIALEFNLAFRTSTKELQKGLKTASSMMSDLTKSAGQLISEFGGGLEKKIIDEFGAHGPMIGTFKQSIAEIGKNLKDTVASSTKGISAGATDILQKAQFIHVSEGIESINKAMGRMVEGFGVAGAEGQKMMVEMTAAMAGLTSKDNIQYFNQFVKQSENLRRNMDDFTPQRFGKIAGNFEKIQTASHIIAELQKKISLSTGIEKKNLEETLTAQQKSIKNLIRENDALAKQGEMINRIKEKAKDLFGKLKMLAGVASLADIVKRAAEAQNNAARIAFKTGINGIAAVDDAMGQFVKTNQNYSDQVGRASLLMGNAMTQAAGEVSANTADIAESWGELASLRVRGPISEMKDLTEISYQMQKAFGISSGEAANFIRDLKVIGGLGTKEIKSAAEGLLGVQRELGLMPGEAREVSATVGVVMRQIRAFGGSAKNISVVTKEIGKLVATFGDVGLEASDATKMIEQMMDPSKINDNIMLWHGLGMTAQEGMQMAMGEGKNMAGMTTKMVGLAKSLKAQAGGNYIVLDSLAKMYGMTYQQVMALTQAEVKRTDKQIADAKLQEAAAAAQRGILDQLKRAWNSIAVIVDKAVLPAISGISWVLEKVLPLVTKLAGAFDTTKEKAGSFGMIWKWIGKIGIPVVAFGMFKLIKNGKLLAGVFGEKGLLKSFGALIKRAPILNKLFKNIKVPEVPGGAVGTKGGGIFKGIADALKGIKPAQLLAIGAAIFFIAAGIALIVFSVSLLAKALKDLNLDQLNALVQIMAITMGGMIAIMIVFAVVIFLLGSAGLAAAPGILAIGAAIFLIAAGVALMMFAMVLLIREIAGLGKNIMPAAVAFGMMIVMLAALTIALYFLIPAVIGLGAAGYASAVGILAIGVAIFLMGAGAALAGFGVLLMAKGMVLLGQNAEAAVKGAMALVVALAATALALFIFMKAVGPAIIAIALLAGMALVFFLAGKAALWLAVPLGIIALSLTAIVGMTDLAVTALGRLATTLKSLPKGFGVNFAAEINMMTMALLKFAAVGAIAAPIMAITAIFGIKGAAPAGATTGTAGSSGAVVSELQTSNQHLALIEKYTSITNDKLDAVVNALKTTVSNTRRSNMYGVDKSLGATAPVSR